MRQIELRLPLLNKIFVICVNFVFIQIFILSCDDIYFREDLIYEMEHIIIPMVVVQNKSY